MAHEFAVIGLGQFGRAVAFGLAEQDKPVLAIDRDVERVQRVASEVDAAIAIDATDREALVDADIESISCAIVTIGSESVEGSILATALLHELGIPRIVVRAMSDLQSRVLLQVGAHEVVDPEQEMGQRLAGRLAHPNIVDQATIGDANIAEVSAPSEFEGKTLAQLDVRNEYGISVVAVFRNGTVNANPRADETISSDDVLYVIGSKKAIDKVASLV